MEERCVRPFYRGLMGLNALSHAVPYGVLHLVGQQTSDEDVVWLLRGAWRPRVMGAWFAAGRTDRLAGALLESLATSAGSLTAPALAAVAVEGLGTGAVPALDTYLRVDLEQRYGAARFIAATLERLDATPEGVSVRDADRAAVGGMLDVAHCLATARIDPRET